MSHNLTTSLLVAAAVAIIPCQAAGQEAQSDWEKAFWERAKEHAKAFDATTRSHFEQMRSNFNAEYADALDGIWKQYEVLPAVQRPQRKDPPKAPVAPPPENPPPEKDNAPAKPVEIIPAKIVFPPIKIEPVPLTLPDIPRPTLPEGVDGVTFDYFGTTCEIGHYNFDPVDYDSKRMKLGDAWKKIESDNSTEKLINDCLRLRESLSLCDMGYLWLIERIAAEIHPESKDSQVFLTAYILNQTGYDVKLGLTDRGLTLLMNTDLQIYGMYSVKFGNNKYYIREKDLSLRPILSYDGLYAANNAIPLRMVPDRMPQFENQPESTTYSSKLWLEEPEFTVTVSNPEMHFLADYPQISWEHYLRAPISDNFRQQVIDQLKSKVAGLNTFDGVRKLLSYVQFGFDYMTDNDQYGHEKVNFPEENFFYPANDCEDRSILFATLVREIYGLDVALLHYPNHISTAVDFRDPTIKGDAINIDGHHYVMCDPTFIGAQIGMSQPQYRDIRPEVYKQ